MKLLSIDIGIKNMGACLFETTDNKQVNIIEWDVLNLLCINKCCFENNSCDKPIKFSKNNMFYCKPHAKKMDDYYIPPEDIQNIHKMKNSKISSLYELCNKYDITYETPITKSDLYEKIKLYINNKYFDSYEQENCNDIDLISVGININIKFDEFLKHHDDIQYIIIENQISPIANRMKTLQGMVAQYFINRKTTNIKFVSSFNKLKLFTTQKLSYRDKKKLSIEVTGNFLIECNHLQTWKTFFLTSKKKDDLADSFLQGYYYLINNQLITQLI